MEWVTQEEIWKWRDAIINKIRLIDLIKEYGIEIIPKNTGLFSHQIRCPFHEGKNGGREKTPSFFISDTTNSYNCFACGAGGTIIDFVSSLEGVLPVVALEKLAKKAGFIDKDGKWDELMLSKVDNSLLKPRETIEPYLFEMSYLIRKHRQQFIGTENFEKEFRWSEKLSKKVDDFIAQIDNEDCEYAIELLEKIRKSIKIRNETNGA